METNFELDSNLDWLECSVNQIELPTTKNKATKHKSDKKWTWSAEVVEKIRTARAQQTNIGMRGKTQSEVTRLKISDANRGRTFSIEHKKMLSEAAKKRVNPPRSDKAKARMSAAAQKRSKIYITPLGTFVGKAELETAGICYSTLVKKMKTNPTEYYSKIKECQE